VVLFYDLMLVGVGMAWMIQAGQARGFLPWHRSALALLYAMPLLSGNLDADSRLLIAPATAFGGFLLAWVMAEREKGHPSPPARGGELPSRFSGVRNPAVDGDRLAGDVGRIA
jgi:hypothetical protein